MQNLIISNTEIRQDAEGRFCLNDLHRAAMAKGTATVSHRPGTFLKRPETIALVAAMKKRCTPQCIDPVAVIKGGNIDFMRQGTFVAKTLVTAYAMWIDADFHLDVIEAFDRASQGQQGLWLQMQALISKEVESKVRASFGSHLMLARKREIPPLRDQRFELEARIQPSLLN